jgi:hypothetical protein
MNRQWISEVNLPQFVHVGVSYGFSRQLSAMMVALGCISEIWSVLFVERKQPRQLRSKNETPIKMGMGIQYGSVLGNYTSCSRGYTK